MSDTDESTWLGIVLVERPIHSTDYLLRGAGILLFVEHCKTPKMEYQWESFGKEGRDNEGKQSQVTKRTN